MAAAGPKESHGAFVRGFAALQLPALSSSEAFDVKMVITLIGFRGTGKSSVAAPLAERLGWRWIDADAEIERRAAKSIRAIFEEDGEAAFRALERDVIAALLAEDRAVIATGGGAVLDDRTREQMRLAGEVVWLKASSGTINQRLADDPATPASRPALTDAESPEEVEQLLAAREAYYRQCATITVETDARGVGEVVDEILAAVQPRLNHGG